MSKQRELYPEYWESKDPFDRIRAPTPNAAGHLCKNGVGAMQAGAKLRKNPLEKGHVCASVLPRPNVRQEPRGKSWGNKARHAGGDRPISAL